MAADYRVMVHYHFRNGMEKEGLHFLENELVKKGHEFGCHHIELWQNEKNPAIVHGIALWNGIDEARRFQAFWVKIEKEFVKRFCKAPPEREFCKLIPVLLKGRKAA